MPKGLSEATKTRIKNDVGDFLLESIPGYLSRGESPVKGENFPKLSPEYKKKKRAEGLPGIPNLEFEGDMLDSMKFKKTDDGIEIGFFGKEAAKADGHLHFSPESKNATAPRRRFLPGEGEEFVGPVQTSIERIVADAITDEMGDDESDDSSDPEDRKPFKIFIDDGDLHLQSEHATRALAEKALSRLQSISKRKFVIKGGR